MRCTLLGTGTSHGIPVIACDCDCCRSQDSKDKRYRCSMWITDGATPLDSATSILIDIGPDFRSQALHFGIRKIDAVLLTHGHADHMNGMDDIRIFSHTCSLEPPSQDGVQRVHPETKGQGLPIYGNATTLQDLHERFSYVFKPVLEGGGKPKINTVDCSLYSVEYPLEVGSLSIIPVPLIHGSLETVGWLLGKGNKYVAYLTDCNSIPKTSMDLLRRFSGKIEHLVIDGLRRRPHSTHFSFSQAAEVADKIGAKHNWFTHICHDMTHVQIEQCFKNQNIAPAYDGLVIEI